MDPAERVFEEVRGHIEGEVYPSLRAKRDAIEHLPRYLIEKLGAKKMGELGPQVSTILGRNNMKGRECKR